MSKYVISYHQMTTDDNGDKRMSPWVSFRGTQEYDSIEEAKRDLLKEPRRQEDGKTYVARVGSLDDVAAQ